MCVDRFVATLKVPVVLSDMEWSAIVSQTKFIGKKL